MAIEKVITIQSSEVKAGKSGKSYLEVIDQDNDKYSCWDEGLWNSLGINATGTVSFEKKGIFRNITAFETAEEGIKHIPPAEEHHEPQEIGMWWKELGNRIGDGSLARDYPQTHIKIKGQYYKKMSEVTGVNFKE
jgi:hypothetical protein